MNAISLAGRGAYRELTKAQHTILFDRATSSDDSIRAATAAILQRVRLEGDAALRALALEFDSVALETFEVPRIRWQSALASLDPKLRQALERAVANIRSAHQVFRPVNREFTTADGVTISRRATPLHRVGVYAPGGRATYPSSLLMGVVPARVAGVNEVIVCSPPAPDGSPSPVLLAAAELSGADRVFALGGAGAVAAMAYGTATIPRVDRIVGPGNAWVAEAKLQVAGVVAIDAPAGPSELLVVADESADTDVIAREMLAQAEHDPMAVVVLVTPSASLAERVDKQLAALVSGAAREAIIRQSLASRGALIVVPALEDALDFAADFAAEHVLVVCRDAEAVADRVRNAGTVFIGTFSSVAFGDYLTGANHVLPTGGLARSYSGLSTIDFYRWTTWQCVSRSAAAALASDVGTLADAEGLPAHATAARYWQEKSV